MQKISTPDLSDLNPSVPFVGLQFNSYGARDFLYGPIKTVHAPNDNSFVKKILATEGQGGVLFVDGNKSFEVALLGDMIAENAYKNNWNGIIILGCVRDVDVLKKIDMGIETVNLNTLISSFIRSVLYSLITEQLIISESLYPSPIILA